MIHLNADKAREKTSVSLHPDLEALVRKRMVDFDFGLSDAIEQALIQWLEPADLVSGGPKIPAALANAKLEHLHLLVPILKVIQDSERKARQDPDPAAGPIEFPRPKKQK